MPELYVGPFLLLGGFVMLFASFMMISGCRGIREDIFFIIGMILSIVCFIGGYYLVFS